ncbi:hypothetical protein AB0K43_02585 [Kitasatospora sp. NPDC049258]|uniref:hypothetical protein n=1 Tax=Kitasatospora sp. NPDC049258 TaxID=3155394 RepID=UPI003434346A
MRDSPEWRIDLKARADLADKVTAFIGEQHSFASSAAVHTPGAVTGPGTCPFPSMPMLTRSSS